MAETQQASRIMALQVSSLGPDDLIVVGLEGTEGISELYRFELECASEKPAKIKLDKLLDKNACILITLNDGSERFIHGLIKSCTWTGADVGGDRRFNRYRVEIVPWLWMLTQTTDCRIFQNKSVPEIIEQIFQDLGFSDFKLDLQGTFDPRDYCVQYRESDFDFVSRLMEEEGIFYFFEHEEDKHTLKLVNTPHACPDCSEQPEALYEPLEGSGEREDVILEWSERREFVSGKYTYRDYQFQTPDKTLEVNTPTAIKVGSNDKLDLYDYPGNYSKQFNKPEERMGKVVPLGSQYTKLRMEAVEAAHEVASATSTCRAFFSGCKFKINAPPGLTTGKFLITSMRHKTVSRASLVSGDDDGGKRVYINEFTCVPEKVPYRPRRKTSKPQVRGSQTAVVVGPAGEEIYPDKYGRVKVQFPWDREGKKNQDSSCWVRVATPWAGKQWGMIHIPRIGQEVIVDFLEGDPDQPIIIGSVYNADQMPPYELPDNMTQSGIKSQSSKGGSNENFNEICFEDKKGEELLYIRAEKDQTIAVENDESHWVGHDRLKTIDNDETTLVHHDRTETVDNNETITIHGNRKEQVGKNESITIGINRTEKVGKNEEVTIGESRTETVGKDEEITIAKNQTITIGENRTETVGKDESISIAKNQTEKVGENRSITIGKGDTLSVGKTLVVSAGDSITFKTGAASITMKKDGTITIKGKDITITGSGKITGTASKDMVLKGKKILQN